MPNDWRSPYDIPDSLQRLLDEQQRQQDQFRDFLDMTRLSSGIERIIADQERQTQWYKDLINSSRIPESLEKLVANERSTTKGIEQMIDAATTAMRPYGDTVDSVGAITTTNSKRRSRSKLTGSSGSAMEESPELQRRLRELENQLTHLRGDVGEKSRALKELEAGSAEKDSAIQALQQTVRKLSDTQRLAHLLARVEPAAQRQLLESQDFRAQFDRDEPCDAYVMSIDIRRSTDLMLKAREPKLFAQFLLGLTRILREIVLVNHGVFDKFTGDGVLAFFPTFYSGVDAGLLVLKAAAEAHDAFNAHYDAHRHCFLTIRRDVGLGIGVDFGRVQIVQIESEFTVVGTPVVYACRMAGAEAGQTLVNQPAFEALSSAHSVECDFAAVDLAIKHEGPTLAYSARLNGRPYTITPAEWYSAEPMPPA